MRRVWLAIAILAVIVLLLSSETAVAGGYLQLRVGQQIGGAPVHDQVETEGEALGRVTLGYSRRWSRRVHLAGEVSHRSSLESSRDKGQHYAEIGITVEF